ncbi:MAG: 30S ribosome-binding factor RbfA [Sandaracinaceae bacterium]
MSSRAERVGERIREELMDLILRGEIKDPGTRGAVVHAVRVTGDLRQATVYIRASEPDLPERRREALVAGLRRAAGFARRQLAQRLELRHAPELRFEWDESADRAARIEDLLSEIKRDEQGDPEP